MSKYIVGFYKNEKVKYVSHLDIVRMIGRAMRRADLKIKHSQGFNPHPLLSFAHPLGVGISSIGELMEIELENEVSPKELGEKLDGVLPDGFGITGVKKCMEKSPFSQLAVAGYEIILKGDFDETVLDFLKNDTIVVPKRTKSGVKDTDIKPMIKGAKISGRNETAIKLAVMLSCGNDNLKPELFVETLEKFSGKTAQDYKIRRMGLYTKDAKLLAEF